MEYTSIVSVVVHLRGARPTSHECAAVDVQHMRWIRNAMLAQPKNSHMHASTHTSPHIEGKQPAQQCAVLTSWPANALLVHPAAVWDATHSAKPAPSHVTRLTQTNVLPTLLQVSLLAVQAIRTILGHGDTPLSDNFVMQTCRSCVVQPTARLVSARQACIRDQACVAAPPTGTATLRTC
jgi:hypothetical protein